MPDTQHAPTVVLVHGAWADGSSWSSVISQLHHAGIPVTAAPLPLTSLGEDTSAFGRVLDRVGTPVIAVAHAYAGAVLGASVHKSLRALVYVAALAPDEGESVADVFYRCPPHPDAPHLVPDQHGDIWLPGDAFARAFAQHASGDIHAVLAATQRPISIACIQEKVAAPRWKELPTWYLQADEDRMISPTTQAFMAARMGAQIRSHRVDHIPLITAPHVVTELIADAYRHAFG